MADNVDIRVRLAGARKAAAEAKDVGKAVAGIGDNSSRVAGQTDRMAKSQGRARRGLVALGGAAKYGGAAMGVGLVVGAKKAVTASSNLGEQVNKTKVIFGDSRREILGWSKGAATSLGMSQRQALETAGQFGGMFSTLGKTDKQAAGMSKRMVGLSADMASFNNSTPQEAFDALRAGLSGESEPLRRFNVFLNETKVAAEAANMGLKAGAGGLTESQKTMARYSIIMRETSKQQGDFGRTSGSWANLQRILAAQFENLAAVAGQRLIPTLEKGGKKLSKFLTQMQTGRGAGGEFVDTLHDMWTEAKPIVTWVGRAAVNTGKFVGRHPELAKVATAIAFVGVAVKGLRFARAVSGIDMLLGGLSRLGRTKAGQKAAQSITSALGSSSAKRKFSTVGQTVGTTVGQSASTAAASGMAGQGPAGAAAGGGVAAKTKAKFGSAGFKNKMRGAGKLAGGALALGLLVEFGDKLGKGLSGGTITDLLAPLSPRAYKPDIKGYDPNAPSGSHDPRDMRPRPDGGLYIKPPRVPRPHNRPGGRVEPLHRRLNPFASRAASSGSNAPIVIPVTLTMDGKAFYRTVVRHDARERAHS